MIVNLRALCSTRRRTVLLAVGAGSLSAGLVAGLASQFEPVWILLVIAGLLSLLPAFVIKHTSLYWLALFLLVLPLDVKKTVGDAAAILLRQGISTIEVGGVNAPEVRVTDLVFLVLLGMWVSRLVRNKEKLYFPPVSYFAIGFIGWAALFVWWAPYPYLSLLDLFRQCKFFVIFLYFSNNIRSKSPVRLVRNVLLFWLFAQATVTILRYEFHYYDPLLGNALGRNAPTVQPVIEDTLLLDWKRSFGTINSPSETATHLEYLIPLALVLSLSSPGARKKLLHLLLLVLGSVALWMTFSRGPMIGLTCGLSACLFLLSSRKLVSKRAIMVILSTVVLLGLALSPKLYSYMITRPENVSRRWEQYRAPARMLLSHPIRGVGLNNSSVLKDEYAPNANIDKLGQIHAAYLVIAAETGVVGLTLYLGFFLLIGWEAMRATRSADKEIALFSVAILGSLVSLAIHLAADLFYRDPLVTMLWVYAGLLVAFRRMDRQRAIAEGDNRSGCLASVRE